VRETSWKSQGAVRAAVSVEAQRHFERMFGCAVPVEWAKAWGAEFLRVSGQEQAARELAREAGRVPYSTFRQKAMDFFASSGLSIEKPLAAVTSAVSPMTWTLLLKFSDIEKRRKAEIERAPEDASRGVLERRFDSDVDTFELTATALKGNHQGDVGPLIDVSTECAFSVWRFEQLPVEVPFGSAEPGGLVWREQVVWREQAFITDLELASLCALVFPREVAIGGDAVRLGTPAREILADFKRKVRLVRQTHGYIHGYRRFPRVTPKLLEVAPDVAANAIAWNTERKAWLALEQARRKTVVTFHLPWP
jgi:hypothetical protein